MKRGSVPVPMSILILRLTCTKLLQETELVRNWPKWYVVTDILSSHLTTLDRHVMWTTACNVCSVLLQVVCSCKCTFGLVDSCGCKSIKSRVCWRLLIRHYYQPWGVWSTTCMRLLFSNLHSARSNTIHT